MPGKFVVKKGPTGKFRFSLVSTNGQVVASSEAYETKAKALGGIRAIKRLAADAEVEDQTTQAWAKQQEQARAASRDGRRAPATRKAAGTRAPASKASATERATRRRATTRTGDGAASS